MTGVAERVGPLGQITPEQAKANSAQLKEDYRPNLHYAYSQETELTRLPIRMRFGQLQGACFAMSYDWIHRRVTARRPLGDKHYDKYFHRIGSITKRVKAQEKAAKLRRETPGPTGAGEAFKSLAEADPFPGGPPHRDGGFLMWDYESSPNNFARQLYAGLTGNRQGGMLFGMSSMDRGQSGHAIALFRQGNSYAVFDPNYGEYRFDDAEAATRFVTRLWDQLYRRPHGLTQIEAQWVVPPAPR